MQNIYTTMNWPCLFRICKKHMYASVHKCTCRIHRRQAILLGYIQPKVSTINSKDPFAALSINMIQMDALLHETLGIGYNTKLCRIYNTKLLCTFKPTVLFIVYTIITKDIYILPSISFRDNIDV